MKVGTEKAAMGAVEVGVACWLTKYNQLGARLFISSAAEGKAIECRRGHLSCKPAVYSSAGGRNLSRFLRKGIAEAANA